MQAGNVASIVGSVQMPTVQHLLSGSLDSYRTAIQELSKDTDPAQWAGMHVILGAALRLRAPRLNDDERAETCLEVIHSFEAALAVCWQRKTARSLRQSRVGTSPFSLQTNGGASVSDGVQMVVDAVKVPVSEGNELIERAIRMFRSTAANADRKSELRAWVIARSNLGCALTLLGRRTPGIAGVPLLEEAIDVLQDACSPKAGEDLQEERASTHVNLAEAYQALAERGMPGERLRCIEQAVNWMAAALGYFAPVEYRWLLQLERASFA